MYHEYERKFFDLVDKIVGKREMLVSRIFLLFWQCLKKKEKKKKKPTYPSRWLEVLMG